MSSKVIVAIDVGMTCTGVCYAVTDQTSQFYMIQTWPGSSGAAADKVPTVVCYRNGRFSSWGFESRQEDDSDPGLDIGEWFKVYLDRKEYRDANDQSWPRSYDDVKRAYRDFLRQIYIRTKEEIESAVLRGVSWRNTPIEFIFSVPTTWTAIAVTNTFESLIHEAGFGAEGPNHKVVIGLTEAQAAAIHTFATEKETYSDGQIILVVDAGGGTTDLALLKAYRKPNGQLAMKELDHVRGLELGSVEIDLAFEELAHERLLRHAGELGLSEKACEKAARKMARDGFRPHKENFGSDMSDRQDTKRVDIPVVSDMISLPHANIRSGGLIVSNDDIRGLFDQQLNRMVELIDRQMNNMKKVAPNDQISFLVLSGGLGSSQYIRKQLLERYVTNRMTAHPYANGIQIIRSRHPQAAPVQGLLHDRLSKESGESIITDRISRFSLGVICDRLYDPNAHINQDVYFDPTDGRRYARGQVEWFIKKGDQVSDSRSLSHNFFRTWKKYEGRIPWRTQIVLSHKNGNLPRNLKEDGVVKLCQMMSDLTKVDLTQFVKHKKPWYTCDKGASTYYSANYEIRFVIGAAAKVDAELWFRNTKYNEPSSFKIDFEEGAAVSAPKEIIEYVDTNYDRFRAPA